MSVLELVVLWSLGPHTHVHSRVLLVSVILFLQLSWLDCITPCAHGWSAVSRAYWVSIYLANTWWTAGQWSCTCEHMFPKVKCISVVWWFSQGEVREPQDRTIEKLHVKLSREQVALSWRHRMAGLCTSSQMLFHSSSWTQWTHNLRNWQPGTLQRALHPL